MFGGHSPGLSEADAMLEARALAENDLANALLAPGPTGSRGLFLPFVIDTHNYISFRNGVRLWRRCYVIHDLPCSAVRVDEAG